MKKLLHIIQLMIITTMITSIFYLYWIGGWHMTDGNMSVNCMVKWDLLSISVTIEMFIVFGMFSSPPAPLQHCSRSEKFWEKYMRKNDWRQPSLIKIVFVFGGGCGNVFFFNMLRGCRGFADSVFADSALVELWSWFWFPLHFTNW